MQHRFTGLYQDTLDRFIKISMHLMLMVILKNILIASGMSLNNFKVRQASTIIWTMGKVWILQMKSHEYGMRSIKTNINKYLDMLHVGLNKKCWALGQNGYPRDI